MEAPVRLAVSVMIVGAAASAAMAQGAAQSGAVKPVPVARAGFIATMDIEFRKMDADKNNVATRAEIERFLSAQSIAEQQARKRATFAQLDADKNGQLSLVEFARLPVAAPARNAAPILNQTDLNKDQQVTIVEYRTAKLANFDRMDADKDGIVSVAEMKAARLIK
jgi:Ca2+-binding EF-hand superfamily protein